METMIGFMIGLLVGMTLAIAARTPDVERLPHPLDPQAHLVRFKGDEGVWTCEPVTATEGK